MRECPHGHPMTEANTIIYPKARTRACLTCDRAVPHRRRFDYGADEDLPPLVLRLLQHLLLDQ